MFTFCRRGKVALLLVLSVLVLPGTSQAGPLLPPRQALAQAVNLLESSVGYDLPQAAHNGQLALNQLGGPFVITAIPPPPGKIAPNNLQRVQKARTFLMQAQTQLTALAASGGTTGTQASRANTYVAVALAQVNNYLTYHAGN